MVDQARFESIIDLIVSVMEHFNMPIPYEGRTEAWKWNKWIILAQAEYESGLCYPRRKHLSIAYQC